jgi:hypothetical protein
MINLSVIAPFDNSFFNKEDSGVYLVIGPHDLLSLYPTQNIIYIYDNGDIVSEGDNFREWHEKEEYDKLMVILLAKSIDHISLQEYLGQSAEELQKEFPNIKFEHCKGVEENGK